jgi:hypothetical protein
VARIPRIAPARRPLRQSHPPEWPSARCCFIAEGATASLTTPFVNRGCPGRRSVRRPNACPRARCVSPQRGAQMLCAGLVQSLVRPVTSHERCGRSHDVGVVPASPPAGILPISRRASEPVATSGSMLYRSSGSRWSERSSKENPRSDDGGGHRERRRAVTASDDERDAPDLQRPDWQPSARSRVEARA